MEDTVYKTIENFKQRLEVINKRRDIAKEAVTKCKVLLDQAKKDQETLIQQIKDKGLEPDKLKAYIIKNQEDINKNLTFLEKVLPDDEGNIHNEVFNTTENVKESVNREIPKSNVNIATEDMSNLTGGREKPIKEETSEDIDFDLEDF